MKIIRRSVLTLTLVGLAAAVMAAAGTDYGKGVTQEQAVAIGELLSNPEPYVGKTVRVDGVITGVCKMRGCWMMVSDPESGQGIRIKVEDGVIVFPVESMGRRASAEGVFEVVVGEHAGRQERAEGEGAAKPHTCSQDAAHAQDRADAKPAATYQIAGVGALIYE